MTDSYKYLTSINSPADLKALPEDSMETLAGEVRDFLIKNVTEHGGHLASNLGVVELSIALHRVFSTPEDHIIFDVGHQSYVHKLLTGRREFFDSIRTPGGLSGFEKRSESEHDAFGTGHSSTSISAALGFAQADKISGRDGYSIAVIGDGAFTGGMVHEALNNCSLANKLIIILNENEMSISKNIGGFANYMAKIRTSKRYFSAKARTMKIVSKIPLIGKSLYAFLRDTKQTIKNILFGSNYFEEMGLFYLGPADGNDYKTVELLLREAKKKGENVIVHLKTKKGKGYAPAEERPNVYHGVAPAASSAKETFHEIFGAELCDMAKDDPAICAITAAMGEGTGLEEFAKTYPDRYFDVGIAEAHALTYASAIAAGGAKPYAAIYSTFLQRGYDNILHDICLQGLPVKIFIDRASLSAADGATHHGIFDVAFLSHIPNISIISPSTFGSLRAAMREANVCESPIAVRYPNTAEDKRIVCEFYPKADYKSFGTRGNFSAEDDLDAVIISYGSAVSTALDARDILRSKNTKAGVIILERLKPYGSVAEELYDMIPANTKVVFLEEGIRNGGAGMLLGDELIKKYGYGYTKSHDYTIMAIDDNFASPEEVCDIRKFCKIDAESVVLKIIKGKSNMP